MRYQQLQNYVEEAQNEIYASVTLYCVRCLALYFLCLTTSYLESECEGILNMYKIKGSFTDLKINPSVHSVLSKGNLKGVFVVFSWHWRNILETGKAAVLQSFSALNIAVLCLTELFPMRFELLGLCYE